ncbi:MAG: hypothetical protein PF450_10540 [Bacteroidales bacterium]|jgi:adenine-specific DNA-methyltransferase|nr:hypothetical protein [Bacteroidales bacterium]
MVDNIKDDRTEEDVPYEVLLKYGLDLTLPINEWIMENGKLIRRSTENGELKREN